MIQLNSIAFKHSRLSLPLDVSIIDHLCVITVHSRDNLLSEHALNQYLLVLNMCLFLNVLLFHLFVVFAVRQIFSVATWHVKFWLRDCRKTDVSVFLIEHLI